MKIERIKQSCFTIEWNQKMIVIDPFGIPENLGKKKQIWFWWPIRILTTTKSRPLSELVLAKPRLYIQNQ